MRWLPRSTVRIRWPRIPPDWWAPTIPARRIDYMFSEGWNHGRRGGWTGDVSLTDTGWSDHMLMEAAILV